MLIPFIITLSLQQPIEKPVDIPTTSIKISRRKQDKPINETVSKFNITLQKKMDLYKVKNKQQIVRIVDRVCKEVEDLLKVKVDKALVYAVIETESGFKNLKPNKIGATGYMQVTPIAYKSVKQDLNIKGSLQDPYTNIKVGTYYLYRNIKKYGLDHSLVAYNMGYKNLDKRVVSSRGRRNSYLSVVKRRMLEYK